MLVIFIALLAFVAGCEFSFGGGKGKDAGVSVIVNPLYRDYCSVIYREYFLCDDNAVEYLKYYDPDDVFVCLEISRISGKDIHFVLDHWKLSGSFQSTVEYLGVKTDLFFVDIPSHVTIGPPYGKAYGHYKDKPSRLSFDDETYRDLVFLKLSIDYYGIDVETALKWRDGGGSRTDIVTTEYRRGGNGKDVKGGAVKKVDHPWEKGKGKGKGR